MGMIIPKKVPLFYQMSLPTKNMHAAYENRERHFTDLCGLFVINKAGFLNTGYKGVLFYFKRSLSRVPGSARLV